MEFVKNKVQEIWGDQAFISSQMDGVESWLVALERVAASFSHFIIEHWVPAQAILIDLHNSTCPSCQRVDAMANNGGLASESVSGPLYPKLSTCFEGARLTQLVQLVTASRLFLGHKGRVDLYIDECLYHCVCFGRDGFLLQVSL